MELSEFVGNPMSDLNNDSEKSRRTVSLEKSSFEDGCTLQNELKKHSSVALFLKLTGVLWVSDESVLVTCLQRLWCLVIRLGLLVMMILFVVFLKLNGRLPFCFVSAALMMQCLSLALALFDMNRRLNTPVANHYILFLNNGLSASLLVLVISFVFSVFPMAYFFSLYKSEGIVFWLTAYCLGQLSMCCLLTAAMYFISVDCAVAAFLVDKLISQCKLQLLTFSEFSLARDAIYQRQAASQWINNSIVIVAILDIFTFLVFLFFSTQRGNFLFDLSIFAFLFKEIPFLVVVYWQVAKVNEKASKLLQILASKRWAEEKRSNQERVEIYVSAIGKPIVMSLAGMKLKRKDLAWQFGLWLFAFAISLVKSIMINVSE